jgi:hypothetical protein
MGTYAYRDDPQLSQEDLEFIYQVLKEVEPRYKQLTQKKYFQFQIVQEKVEEVINTF